MKKTLFPIIMLFIAFTSWAAIPDGYYSDAEGKTGDALKASLHDIIDGHTQLSYDDVWYALWYTDEDPDNTDNVILLYSGWSYPKTNKGGGTSEWNREHTWAKSQGDFGTSKGPGTDIHHLRPTDVTVNSARGNKPFYEGGSYYTDPSRYGGGRGATECKSGSGNWEPADNVKGDVARMLFYMATRYESEDGYELELGESSSTSGKHGKLSSLLAWHIQDPVDAWEIRRNNRIQEKQGNRNPFIDHPEYVCSIWGGECDSNYVPPVDTIVDPVTPNVGGFNLTFDSGLDGCTSYQLTGSTKWEQNEYKGSTYLYVNTYEQPANETWVVTPSVNLDELSDVSFTFDVSSYNASKKIVDCGAGQFEVYYSTSYDGTSIDASQWTRFTSVDDVMLAEKWAFVSVPVDISSVSGDNVTFAFVHKSNDSNGTTWEVDNIILAGNIPTDTEENKTLDLDVYPNPAFNIFKINKSIERLEVVSITGNVEKVVCDVEANENIDISNLTSGLYIVRMTDGNHSSIIKLMKR